MTRSNYHNFFNSVVIKFKLVPLTTNVARDCHSLSWGILCVNNNSRLTRFLLQQQKVNWLGTFLLNVDCLSPKKSSCGVSTISRTRTICQKCIFLMKRNIWEIGERPHLRFAFQEAKFSVGVWRVPTDSLQKKKKMDYDFFLIFHERKKKVFNFHSLFCWWVKMLLNGWRKWMTVCFSCSCCCCCCCCHSKNWRWLKINSLQSFSINRNKNREEQEN